MSAVTRSRWPLVVPLAAGALYWRSLTWMMCGRMADAINFLENALRHFQGETKMLASFLLLIALALGLFGVGTVVRQRRG